MQATSTGKLLDIMPRNYVVAELCSGKFNVAYSYDPHWKFPTPTGNSANGNLDKQTDPLIRGYPFYINSINFSLDFGHENLCRATSLNNGQIRLLVS
jgi:hypothetical protein